MRYRILPYRQGSASAKALADALGGKVLKLEGSKYKCREGDVVIGWGNTNHPGWSVMLNKPEYITEASNKLNFFRLMATDHADLIPKFWTNREEIPDDAFPIVCRAVLAGHSGAGITISPDRGSLAEVPLYVQYVKKKDEYRVHVGKKEVVTPVPNAEGQVLFGGAHHVTTDAVIIAVQRKARRLNVPDEEVNWQVRNLAGGFIFQREGVDAPPAVIEAARSALLSSGLDFGAVDVIWNEHEGKAYVLEINTAPGLEGQTIEDYADYFRNSA